jgi:hypothetical protein
LGAIVRPAPVAFAERAGRSPRRGASPSAPMR